MRTFRNLYHQKELLNLIKLKFIPNPNVSISKYRQIGCFSCQFRSIDRRLIHSSSRWSDNVGRAYESSSVADDGVGSSFSGVCGDENPRVRTAFDPVANEVVTRKVGEDEKSATLGNIGSFIEGSLPERSASGDKKNSDDEEPSGTPKSWSNLYRREEKVTPKRSENRGGENLMRKSVSTSRVGDFAPKKKTGKSKSSWVCSDCGDSFGQWWGSCRSCGASGTLTQFTESQSVESKPSGFGIAEKVTGTWFHQKSGGLTPQRLTDVNKGVNQLTWRIPLPGLFGAEVARVLGGGLVPGSLVLVGGDPGVGKSTLLLQMAAMIAEEGDLGRPAPVLYVSGEESVEQIGNRADRMKIRTEDLFLYSSTDIEDILEKIQVLSPRALIVDSIQTVYLKGVSGSAGGIQQVKECTSSLLRFAKKTNIPVLLIGHVTKTGDIAGPRVLEHIVDVVLYMEGEEYSAHRFLRAVKNRFGSTDELGVFEMSQKGLQAVSNPSEIFLSEQHPDSEILAGLAVAVIIDGSRTFLLEIQALCLSESVATRQYNGVQPNRAEMIISVLIKQAGLKLQNNAIFVNIVSGVKLKETAGDLAIAVAVCSSYLEFPIPNDVAFIGEIGLGGELRPVSRMEKRVNAVVKLGYKKCIVPKSAVERFTTLDLNGMMILGCGNLKEVINIVFQS
ncbi:Dna repair protein rada [Thalictrum thalictroides]|uniref:Dna repair protein rada n=1 Tax=Thalictrum thalictroides TaxID=46969 RepID=A0A7J6WUY7_THATH|nr:Dna repair protein rada [Thalictrum thalictroides]